jgi:hypothetical protein
MQRYKIFPNQQIKSQQIITNFPCKHNNLVVYMAHFLHKIAPENSHISLNIYSFFGQKINAFGYKISYTQTNFHLQFINIGEREFEGLHTLNRAKTDWHSFGNIGIEFENFHYETER